MANESESDVDSIFENAASDIVDAITGSTIPEPIKRNFFKACGQLCTAAVEIPVSYLEGIASERRAETQARIKIIERSASEIAEQMQFDPEYAKAAVKKFGQRVIREQVNLDQITQKAAEALTESVTAPSESFDASQPQINDDWLNVFEKEAGQKSTDEMQSMFAKVLAGEIQRPSTYSIKSIRLLGSLDQRTAKLFKHFCSMCIILESHGHIFDARVPSLGANAASNGLSKFGISFDALNILQEYGLIISDYNSWMDYSLTFGNETQPVPVPFKFGNSLWGLVRTEESKVNQFKISGVALTQSGKELTRVVLSELNTDYSVALAQWFETKKISMVEVRASES